MVTILDVSAIEKWDKFVSDLKPKIQFEVCKWSCAEFEESTKIAMRVEPAFAGVPIDSKFSGPVSSSPITENAAYEPMKIGNTEFCRTERSKKRLVDIQNSSCYKCHKPGCRPWTHRCKSARSVKLANVETTLAKEEQVDCPDSSEN